jgi:NADPH:quinone reductase-like Zn-dependent oxidoreductase
MKAFAIDKYKGDLTAREVPDPSPGPGDVVVAIAAASVNPIDWKLRDGEFKAILPAKMPLILGNDLAGTVVTVGAGARRFKVGDKVFARPDKDRIGTFAERIAIAEADLALKPASLGMTDAAALPLVALTAWQVLVERARVKPGDKVLIHAGSGGVGTVAIQLAKHLGATVATTVGTDNIDLVKSLGADVVIDYRKGDFAKWLNGYDVVLNSLGPDVHSGEGEGDQPRSLPGKVSLNGTVATVSPWLSRITKDCPETSLFCMISCATRSRAPATASAMAVSRSAKSIPSRSWMT